MSYGKVYPVNLKRAAPVSRSPRPSAGGRLTHLVQVGVAPHLAIGEHARHDPALLVDVRPLAHGPALQAGQAPVEEVGDIDSCQATAGEPEEGAAHLVINDPQRELPVVVVDLFRPNVPVVVNGQEIPSMDLRETRRAWFERRHWEC